MPLADYRHVECRDCGHTWVSKAETPQCTQQECRGRNVKFLKGDEIPDSHEQPEQNEQPNEQPESNKSSGSETDRSTEMDKQTVPETGNQKPDLSDSNNQVDSETDEMVTPAEYQEYHGEKPVEPETDDSKPGVSSDKQGSTGFGLPISKGTLAMSIGIMAAGLIVYLYLKRKKASQEAKKPVGDSYEAESGDGAETA
jgi:hypothetical protein